MTAQQRRLLSSTNLISINKAATYTPYSPEYLSLLARKGKILAVKVSRDWLTTPEAVLTYLEQQEEMHKRKLEKIQEVKKQLSANN